MKKGLNLIISTFLLIFIINFLSAQISDDLHLNIQVRDSSGNIVKGTFDFTFNFSTTQNCNNVIYSNSSSLTTDNRGIISYYLPDFSSLNFTEQYFLCYYRDGTLKSASKIVRTPYAFNSKFLQGAKKSAFMPFNKTVSGQFDFNGAWQDGGLSIINGDIYAQNVFTVNLTSLNVSSLGINGSLIPNVFDNTFDLGSSSLNWKDLWLGGNADILGTLTAGILKSLDWTNVSITESQISGLVHTTDTNETTRFDTLTNTDCSAGNLVIGIQSDGTVLCVADESGGSSPWNRSSTKVFLANTGDKVGIGTSNPSEKLDVNGTIYVSHINNSYGVTDWMFLNATQIGSGHDITILNSSGDRKWRFGYLDDNVSDANGKDGFRFYSDDLGAHVLVLRDSGNVGIGTTNPSTTLMVKTDTTQFNGIRLLNSIGAAMIDLVGSDATDNDGGIIGLWDGGNKKVQIWSAGNSYFNGGNVGIGTTNPGELLEVAGNINSTGGDICITGGNCLSNAGIGTMSSWTIAGDDDSSAVSDGQTVTIAGSSTIDTVQTTRTVAISVQADSIGDTQLAFNTGQALTTTSNPTFNGLTLTDATEQVITFDGGDAYITVHDGLGNFNILSGIDYNNLIKAVAGGTRIELGEGGVVDIEIYSGSVGTTGTEVASFAFTDTEFDISSADLDVSGTSYLNGIVLDNDADITGADIIQGWNDLRFFGDAGTMDLIISAAGLVSTTAALTVGTDLTVGDDIFISEDGLIGISASTERIVFDGSAGQIEMLGANVGIGTSNPSGKLHVTGGNTFIGTGVWTEGLSVGSTTTASSKSSKLYVSGIIGDGSRAIYGYNTGGLLASGVMGEGAAAGAIGVHGKGSGYDFYASGAGTNYGAASSIRWKRDIKEISNALNTVLNLRGVEFNWNEEYGGKHDIGFIGEEVGKYIPEIVEFDPSSPNPNYYVTGIDYSKFTPILLQAIKELKSEKDSEIQNLKNENDLLKSELCQKDNSYSWC